MSTFIDTPSTAGPAEAIHILESRLAQLRGRLTTHPLYANIRTSQHLRTFMHLHVVVAWDFMSLLKLLQTQLTCTRVPWLPSPNPSSRRFLNEIVLGASP